MFDVHFVFGIFGNIAALILFLVPLITFWKILKMKSTDQFSGIPYVSTLLNCLLSAWYGLPFVSPNNILVSTINGTGSVIELCYVIVFLFYIRDKKYRAKIFGLLVIVLLVFGIIAVVSIFALHGNGRKLLCGFAAAIFSICMYASPLSIMRMVIRTKSVKYMPFNLSLFVFLCGTSWFVFGLLGGDPFVAVPNGVGSVLGAMQLILYAIYKDWKSIGKKSTSIPAEGKQVGESEMEMGYAHANGIAGQGIVIQAEKKKNGI
ncbi:bidirectional sugar transporter SWEET1 [Cryptomeria japonica]|uniref:bidirectional sugar transporter SWEET1 n=1 Tax=Cryptomeria japonica TaxID=3369 RepID=UPI0027DA5A39|nr:bidirectional sugar transporter SWEET1 [Cryptomeria japonica]